MWLSALTDEQRSVLIGLAHDVIVSDGVLDPNEELMLDEFKREMALSSKSGTDSAEVSRLASIFGTPRTRRIAVINLLRLSYVDGEFDIEEECLLKQISNALGIDSNEFQRMDNWVRRLVSLEVEARDSFLQK